MTQDVIGADVADSANVAVGKDIHQQVVNVAALERADEAHVLTVRLLNQAMLHHFGEMKRELKAEMDALRSELQSEIAALRATQAADAALMRKEIDATLARAMDGAVMLPENHETIFNLAFVALYAPVPFFYSQVRDFVGVSWAAALGIATAAYVTSSYLWRHMWRGGRRAR